MREEEEVVSDEDWDIVKVTRKIDTYCTYYDLSMI